MYIEHSPKALGLYNPDSPNTSPYTTLPLPYPYFSSTLNFTGLWYKYIFMECLEKFRHPMLTFVMDSNRKLTANIFFR